MLIMYVYNYFLACQTTSTATIASEQRKLFGQRQCLKSSRSKSRGKKPTTCTIKFVCLSSKNATSPPKSIRERNDLANCGLGDSSITFDSQDIVCGNILAHYPPLKNAGRFELNLFQRGGGEDGGFCLIQPPHVASPIKELAGQAKVYIKPIQQDIGQKTMADSTPPDKIQVCSILNTTIITT